MYIVIRSHRKLVWSELEKRCVANHLYLIVKHMYDCTYVKPCQGGSTPAHEHEPCTLCP